MRLPLLRHADIVRCLDEEVPDARPLSPGPERPIVAARNDEFAAVFCVEVDDDATLYSRLVLVRRDPLTARWLEIGTAGSRRQLEHLPWVPPEEDSEGLFVTDSTSLDIEESDGVESVVRAIAGFGAPYTSAIEVRRHDATESIRLVEPLRPFVVVAVGEDPVEIAALSDKDYVHSMTW